MKQRFPGLQGEGTLGKQPSYSRVSEEKHVVSHCLEEAQSRVGYGLHVVMEMERFRDMVNNFQ